jgi:ABC-type multidrug transport system ATPase subunit
MLLEHLMGIGLGYIALNPIHTLTENEKMIIQILLSGLSGSCILAMDLTKFIFNENELKILQRIFCQLRNEERFGIVASVSQTELIQSCFDHTLYIINGKTAFSGTLDTLCREADKTDYIITHSDPQAMLLHLKEYLPEYRDELRENKILALNEYGLVKNKKDFYRHLSIHGLIPDLVEVNYGNVQFALQELNKQHDL